MNHKILILILVLLIVCGCSLKNSISIDILDSNNEPINGTVIIPLYSTSSGVTFVEGHGSGSGLRYFVGKPFVFNSSNDIFDYIEGNKGIMLPFPPFAFVGSLYDLEACLVLKEGYYPISFNKSTIFGTKTVKMVETDDKTANETVVKFLLSENASNNLLEKIFNTKVLSSPIFLFDDDDKDLLTSLLMKKETESTIKQGDKMGSE